MGSNSQFKWTSLVKLKVMVFITCIFTLGATMKWSSKYFHVNNNLDEV
jgi:hypothetical protein